MTKHYDDDSPVHGYLTRFRGGNAKNLPVPRQLTPAAVNTPQFQEYLKFIEIGDPRQIAEALVEGRLGVLQHRRDMINYVRSFVRLPSRPMSPAKQIADVTRQLTDMYRRASDMMRAKNALVDQLIQQETKTGKRDLERATYEAKIAGQRRIRAEQERQMRQADGSAAAAGSSHVRLARIAAVAKDRYATGSLERRKWLRVEEASQTYATLEQIKEALGDDFDEEVRATLTKADIRLD